jgi:ATP synthase protein I
MLTTTLLSKYLARQVAKRAAKRELQQNPPAKTNESQGNASTYACDEEEGVEAYFEPLTPEQAQTVIVSLRKTASLLSPWRLIMLQLLVGVIATVVALVVSGEKRIALSVAYGAVAVVLPAGMFAWGVMRRQDAPVALVAGLRFFIWEVAKVGLTVAMLFAAPALVVNISWLALLAGFVVTMKVYWVAIWLYPVRNNSI